MLMALRSRLVKLADQAMQPSSSLAATSIWQESITFSRAMRLRSSALETVSGSGLTPLAE
jgi:hypothetical protein